MRNKSTKPSPPIDRASTSHPTSIHYDNSPEFFQGFLDPYLKYSTGIFSTTTVSFEQAAVAALDKCIDLACCRNNFRVLEIGSGWGSLARRLSERFSGISYTSINPSHRQNEHIRGILPTARLHEGSFEQLTGISGPYDAIFLLGSFCHLKDKAAALGRFGGLLAEGGTIVMEDSWFYTSEMYRAHATRPETNYVQQDIFGYAHITSVDAYFSQVDAANLRPVHMIDTTNDYATTINAWIDRMAELNPATFPERDSYLKYLGIGLASMGYTVGNYIFSLKKLPSRPSGSLLKMARLKRALKNSSTGGSDK